MKHSCEITQDIIVIGASVGGVEGLSKLVAGLAPDLPAAVFVVLHIGNHPSVLPEILTHAGPLPAVHPSSGQRIERGKIYVAPPDHHLLIALDHVRLSHGAKENRARPAVNPLFRSAAKTYGARVTGVILTGGLDDGTAGLAEIKRHGGIAVVQDPQTAYCASMPQSALDHVDVDYVAPLSDIPAILSRLATTTRLVEERGTLMHDEPLKRTFSGITCPECRGPIWEERQDTIVEYRCRVGHAYSPLALAEEHREAMERTLWATLVALEEAADIAEQLDGGQEGPFAEDARKKRGQIALVQRMLEE